MAFLRQKIKQKLIEKQHIWYKNEILSKNITYKKWIAEQEKTYSFDCTICRNEEENLINDYGLEVHEERKGNTAGKLSQKDEEFQIFSFVDENGQLNEKTYFALSAVKKLYENPKNVLGVQKLDYIMLLCCDGQVNEPAWGMIYEQFCDPDVILIYGDEDQLVENGTDRDNPWLKPDWSPDRFLSGFYLGGMVAVRVKALREAWEDCCKRGIFEKTSAGRNEREWLYLLLFEMLKAQNCFSVRSKENISKVYHIRHVLYNEKQNAYEELKSLKLPDFAEKELDLFLREDTENRIKTENNVNEENQMLSIIIPSRDNPAVLFHCLDSMLDRTVSKRSLEIIVVDNGSRKENRERISRKIDEINRRAGRVKAAYLYEPMNFNFSKMCNIGAEKATGELFLFLNDDMEIIQPDWLELMAEKARLPYAGAVGAKLLYPDSDIIQHAGITNLRVGPAHKLQYLSDQEDHYYGMNRGVHNMLAVTGACLMVRRDVFQEAGGFCEELAVAFNDVDLCYTIYEKGYYNIVRNDVRLYHHESLSRGKDGESEEKQLRHLKEKDLLYERHLSLYGKDPFYHPWLLNDMLDSRYSMAYCNPVTLDMPWSRVVSCEKALKKAREDECLVVGMECARDIYRWLHSLPPEKGKEKAQPEDLGYYFQGYSFIIGADNACYKKKLLLQNKKNGQVLAVCADVRYRQDIENNLPDQMNVGLTGFAAKLPKAAVSAGIYRFGILAEDRCSRQKLVNWSNWVMEVEADGRQCVREGKEAGREND